MVVVIIEKEIHPLYHDILDIYMLPVSRIPPHVYSCLCPRQDCEVIGFEVGEFRFFAISFCKEMHVM